MTKVAQIVKDGASLDKAPICPIMTAIQMIVKPLKVPGKVLNPTEPGGMVSVEPNLIRVECLGPDCAWWREEWSGCVFHSFMNLPEIVQLLKPVMGIVGQVEQDRRKHKVYK